MDPFTEKLLERTRARRENLQKKMADRPNAVNRPMVKRSREPLADTNSVLSEPVIDKAPQPSTKRLCSGEKIQPAIGEENQEPSMAGHMVPVMLDPPTDKKPPVGPSFQEKPSTLPDVQSQQGHLKTVQPEPEKMVVTPQNLQSKGTPATSTVQVPKANQVEDSGLSTACMKSRLQRLAEQRKCWDGTSEATLDCAPPSLPKRQDEVPPVAVPSVSSGNPIGRRGRLANLAATIGSWEDDLSHANMPKEHAKEKTGPTVGAVTACTKQSASEGPSAASSKTTSKCDQTAHFHVKPGFVVPPSPQKALHSVSSPQKSSSSTPQKSSNHDMAFPTSPHKAGPSCTTSVPHSPLKNQVLCKGLNHTASPQKPELCAKPALVVSSAPLENKAAGVKSFMERFGERCQERTNQSSPAGGTVQAKTPTVSPSVTSNTRLVQDRLRAAQAVNTATADLTQRQRMERESELAQIRNRFQNGNMWTNKDESVETKKNTPVKKQPVKPKECEEAPCELESTTEEKEKTGHELAVAPPALSSSPLKAVHAEKKVSNETEEKEDVLTEIEMNVDQSINSAVINDLFDGVLEQSDEEEEDALNISSMSLLTPLAETVAAVVKSPERRMMTSTPACSFIVKSPENVSNPSNFQRMNITGISSPDSAEALDDNYKLPYSVDAYRSIRVKEMERPSVKQVIVRNEDVSHRSEETRGAALFSMKQRMKVLTNEMNLQQTVIHQASQALNCCTDEEHGKGSQVEAEAERLLMVAMEKRTALKAELERLRGAPGQKRGPAAPDSISSTASRGSITLQELRLPLKAEFVCSIANKPESNKHSFFIMIRAGVENTVATPLASTHRGLSGDTLTFPTKFSISDVSSDFAIDIEVYCLVQKRDICSDKKKKPSKSKAITPKRLLGITKSVQTPVVASPGGPNAVRTSNFALVGSHKLSLSSIGKNKFPLEKIKYDGCERELLSDMFHSKVPFLCPLEGHIYLKMQCEVGSKVEERGFLTMFEDVSGFGAWHRRWCVLSGYYISYWTYPDDEKCKKPIGRINLANCASKRVEPANREYCARPNTFELITVRPQRETDKETLVSQCKDALCVTTNWVSADTKDERNLWMKKLNQIVVDLRMWQPNTCYQPL